ncbi:MAG TPA: transposase [Candidatus Paceibacterota bacterium]|nr:transposase [Candidatus Paceibacterota bacterium]
MSRKTILASGEFYHLYNRGTEKRKIFMDKTDYERFLALLYLCNSTLDVRIDNVKQASQQGSTLLEKTFQMDRGNTLIDLNAYCLMPNHFHILAHEHTEGGISRFMQKLTTAYTMYFNTRYKRMGALFQGKYRAEHAKSDRYLKYLISYIHLNPIKLVESKWKETGIKNKIAAKEYLRRYRYSSFLDYGGHQREEIRIITRDSLPRYFETPKGFTDSVTEWLSYRS